MNRKGVERFVILNQFLVDVKTKRIVLSNYDLKCMIKQVKKINSPSEVLEQYFDMINTVEDIEEELIEA